MQRANWYSLRPPSCSSLRASRFPCSCRSPVPGTCTESSAGLGNYCASQLTRKDIFPYSCFQWHAGSMLFYSLLQMHSVCVWGNPEKYCAAPLIQYRGKLGYSIAFGGFGSFTSFETNIA